MTATPPPPQHTVFGHHCFAILYLGLTEAASETIARGYHTAITFGGAMYVFGGCTDLATAKSSVPNNFTSTALWKYVIDKRRFGVLTVHWI